MTYGFTVHYDIEIDFVIKNEAGEYVNSSMILKIFLGTMPIMLHSNMCLLNNMARQFCFNSWLECKNDRGGYFIIDGKENDRMSEQFANNMINTIIMAMSYIVIMLMFVLIFEDASKPTRNLSVRIVRPDATYTNNQIVINVPNVRKPIPLFILMRSTW